MFNLIPLINELRQMNDQLSLKLDQIVERLDTIIELERNDLYGDGK
jgi:hypothetical protein